MPRESYPEQAKLAFLHVGRVLWADQRFPRATLDAKREGWAVALQGMAQVAAIQPDARIAPWLPKAVRQAAELLAEICFYNFHILSDAAQAGIPKNTLASIAVQALDRLHGSRDAWTSQISWEEEQAWDALLRAVKRGDSLT